jgi:hypothetical protein
MNIKNVKKREILEFKQFLKVINDPWNPKNMSKEDRSPFHEIKLEKPYEYVGYGDAIFKHQSKIDYPGYGAKESGIASNTGESPVAPNE